MAYHFNEQLNILLEARIWAIIQKKAQITIK